MAGFNAENFLKTHENKSGFDPESFLNDNEKREEFNPLEAGAMGLAQGVTYNTADEISAGVSAGWDYLTGKTDTFEYEQNQKYFRDQFNQAKEDQPGVSLAAEVVGAIASPVNKVLAPLKLVKGIGRIGQGAIEGGLMSAGASEGENLGDIGKDIALGVLTGGVAVKAHDKATIALKKAFNESSKLATNIANRGVSVAQKSLKPEVLKENVRDLAAHTANVFGDIPKEMGKELLENPKVFLAEPRSMEELATAVAGKINDLNKKTVSSINNSVELLSSKPEFTYESLQKKITGISKLFKFKPSNKSDANALSQVKRIRDTLDEFYLEAIDSGRKTLRLSQKELKEMVRKIDQDTYSNAIKTDFSQADKVMRLIRRNLNQELEKSAKKHGNTAYIEAMREAEKNLITTKKLSKFFQLKRPDSTEGFADTALNLVPTDTTHRKFNNLTKQRETLKVIKKFDPKLTEEIRASDIIRRTEGGQAAGSKNINYGLALGYATGNIPGMIVGGALGHIKDKYGRKVFRPLLLKVAPKVGGIKGLNRKLNRLTPKQLDVVGGHLKNGRAAAVVSILNLERKKDASTRNE